MRNNKPRVLRYECVQRRLPKGTERTVELIDLIGAWPFLNQQVQGSIMAIVDRCMRDSSVTLPAAVAQSVSVAAMAMFELADAPGVRGEQPGADDGNPENPF